MSETHVQPLPNSLRFPRSEAVYGTGEKAAEVAHFAEPLREQRVLARGKALADLSSLRVLQLTGPDRLSWLNSLTTQKIDQLAPGESTETLVLSPTGHIEGWLRLVDDGETLWALSDLRTQEAVTFLDRMRFMLRVEIADVTEAYQAVGFVGAPPEDLAAAAVWNDPWPAIGVGSASYAEVDAGAAAASAAHPGTGTDFRIAVVERGVLRDWAHAGLEVAGRDAWEALRVEAWRPGTPEVDHRALVGELDVLRTAVHLAKGCYRGQEAVARVHNLGQPPRRLVFLHLDGSGHVLPLAGAEVRAEVRGKLRAVGHVTTAALHWELGPVALALVKRSLAADAPLQVVVSADAAGGGTAGDGAAGPEDGAGEGSGAGDDGAEGDGAAGAAAAGTDAGGEAGASVGAADELIAAAQETVVAVSKDRAVATPPRNADVDARRR